MERLKDYTEKQGILLSDFVLVMRDLHRDDLPKEGIPEVLDRHLRIVQDCIDEGLLTEICEIREKWQKQFGK